MSRELAELLSFHKVLAFKSGGVINTDPIWKRIIVIKRIINLSYYYFDGKLIKKELLKRGDCPVISLTHSFKILVDHTMYEVQNGFYLDKERYKGKTKNV